MTDLKRLFAEPWLEFLASIPLLATLVWIGALQVRDERGDALVVDRLRRVGVWLGAGFALVVAARFVLLAS